MKQTFVHLSSAVRAYGKLVLILAGVGCAHRAADPPMGILSADATLPLSYCDVQTAAGQQPSPSGKRESRATLDMPVFLPVTGAVNEDDMHPIFADAGYPLPSTQSTGSTRPAAARPEHPTPTPVAARVGPLTPYDEFKLKLQQTTGTKYILSLDFVDQQILDAPSKGYNRGVARFDLGIDQDLWKGATFSMDARGGVGNGLDPLIPNFVNTNQYEAPGAPIYILRLAFYQQFFQDKVIVRIGKFDVGDFMDYNRFGSYNFLAYSFAHNTVIPLPGNTLGALVRIKPVNWLILQGGFSNVDQAPTEAGFTSFGNGHYLQLYEVAYVPKFFGQDGTYRFLGWFDNRVLSRPDGMGVENGRGGFGISFDQNITKTFGLFCRYGYTDQHVFDATQYWSAGLLWTGPFTVRPKDTFALGVLQNIYGQAHRSRVRNAADQETLVETYYQYELNPYTSVVPTFQYVGNPNGMHRKGEFIAALHVNLHF